MDKIKELLYMPNFNYLLTIGPVKDLKLSLDRTSRDLFVSDGRLLEVTLRALEQNFKNRALKCMGLFFENCVT